MEESSYSRRQLVSAGVLFGTTALAGCLGSGGSEYRYTPDREPGSGGSEIESIDELEAPRADSSLSGTVGGGEPKWIDANNMGFKGWYDANDYYPRLDYNSKEVTLSIVNVSGYIVTVSASAGLGNQFYYERLALGHTEWFRRSDVISAEIQVMGGTQSEELTIDLTDNHHYEIWLDGTVFNPSYWVGTW